MFQLRDRLFAGTAHEMAHPKRSKSQFFRNKACYREIFRRSNFLQRFGPCCPAGTFLVIVPLKNGRSSRRLVPPKPDGLGND